MTKLGVYILTAVASACFRGPAKPVRKVVIWGLVCVICFGWPQEVRAGKGHEQGLSGAPSGEGSHSADFSEDIDAAVTAARADGRGLFVLFTGSDWCPPCKKLESEVFAKPEFLEAAQKDFHLVKLDFPQQREQPPEIATRNQEWAQRYGISGFPTIAVLDSQLRPIGFLGYIEGGPQPFLAALIDLHEKRVRRDLAWQELANAVTDEDRARIMDRALSQLDEQIVQVYYEAECEQIAEWDSENRLLLREKYRGEADAEMRKIVLTDILMVSRLQPVDEAAAFIDEVLKTTHFPPEERFKVLQIKLNLWQQHSRTNEAAALVDEMLAIEGLLEETRERLLVKKVWQFVLANDPSTALQILDTEIAKPGNHLHLRLARGTLLQKQERPAEALAEFDRAIPLSRLQPDILIELVANKADLQVSLGDAEAALQTLENFAEDTQMPTDLRCEALLHSALIMRESGRLRPAMLTENRAVELADSPDLKREIQYVVERIRARAEKKVD